MPFIFLAFDGMDGAGKSTQVERLKQAYEEDGATVLLLSHPRHESVGKLVRDTLHVNKQRFDPWVETFLYAADQAETNKQVLLPLRQQASSEEQLTVVLAHRWYYSSLVYQALVDGAVYEQVRAVCKIACPIAPMAALLYAAEPEIAHGRIRTRGEVSVSPYETRAGLVAAYSAWRQVARDAELQPQPRLIDTSHLTIEQTWEHTLRHLTECGVPLPAHI